MNLFNIKNYVDLLDYKYNWKSKISEWVIFEILLDSHEYYQHEMGVSLFLSKNPDLRE